MFIAFFQVGFPSIARHQRTRCSIFCPTHGQLQPQRGALWVSCSGVFRRQHLQGFLCPIHYLSHCAQARQAEEHRQTSGDGAVEKEQRRLWLPNLLWADQSIQKGQDSHYFQGEKYESGHQKAAKEENLLRPHPCLSDSLRQAELLRLVHPSVSHREKVNHLQPGKNPLTKREERDIISPKQGR